MALLDNGEAQSLELMSDEEFWKRARARAFEASIDLVLSEAGLHQYLECELPRGKCFIPLHTVEEVIPAPHRFATLPLMPRWMPGILAWRGEIAAVVNLEEYLFDFSPPLDGGMLLIVRHADCIVGLRVSMVGLTTTIEPEQLTLSIISSMLYVPSWPGIVRGVYAGSPVLDVAALLYGLMRDIGLAAPDA